MHASMERQRVTAHTRFMRSAMDPDEIISTVNVTPLVDIVLVLLIVLMTAVAYVNAQTIPMDLPEVGGVPTEAPTIVVSIDARDAFYADGQPVTLPELRDRAAQIAPARDARAILAANPEASHDAFVRALDVLRLAGIRHYGVQVEPAE